MRSVPDAIIKLEAYPFTRHGYLEGVVEFVSPDAVADDARGLVFPARVRIRASRLRNVNFPGQREFQLQAAPASVNLAPGAETIMRAGDADLDSDHAVVTSDEAARDRARVARSAVSDPASPNLVRDAPTSEASISGLSRAQTAWARALTPGMSAQVEIITGRRSVASYILSPIARAASEAGRER